MTTMLGVLFAACGSVPPSQFGDSAPFASNDDQCASASLGNEPDDDIVLGRALDCLFTEYDAGNPVTIDIAVATVEGDPIFHRYRYDGETVLIVEDSRADEFGTGSVRARICEDIVRGRRLPESDNCERVSHPGFPEAD
jgi:hypothetical protein